jgi:hypothetical protein
MAQAKPFIGYDKVAWGASVADVRKAYNIGSEIPSVVENEDKNITTIDQKNVSDSISTRTFMFNGNKLYRVYVTYADSTNGNGLTKLLSERYSNPTDTYSERGLGLGYSVVVTNHYIYGKFSPDIEVELFVEENTLGMFSSTRYEVYYTWKKFRDAYQASKIDL